MGKNRIIQIIGKLIAGMTSHKILCKNTNKKESINHMESEIINYRGELIDFIAEYNWNTNDKNKIKEEAKKRIKLELRKPHFKGIYFPQSEVDKFLNQSIKEFFTN
ncbi:MAG: hypothetical protein Q8N99_00830 [Nanoarchaeota archaeon]|nr:hypothetical protein [Nanoarchaeota archaeon]